MSVKIGDRVRRQWRIVAQRTRQMRRSAKYGLVALVMGTSSMLIYFPLHSQAVGANMMLFWDPANGAIPTGWTEVTSIGGNSIAGRYPRGEAVANYGVQGGNGSRPFTPTTNTITLNPPSNTTESGGNGSFSAATHTHTFTTTIGADNNGDASNPDEPAFRSLQLMAYNSGIPNTIPQNAIAMFDSTIPSSFTQISSSWSSKVIKVNSTLVSGGGDTISNTVTFGTLAAGNSASLGRVNLLGGTATATTTHTHTAPAAVTACNSGCTGNALPPYVQPLLAKANVDTPTLAIAITAMFDADPGNGWSVRSNSGGAYYQQFIRAAPTTASLTSLGAATHTDTTITSGASGAATGGNPGNTLDLGGNNNLSGNNHTHTITVSFNSVSNLPPYFNVIIAEKVSFTLQNYRWFIDTNTEDVSTTTDPWPSGSVDIAGNTAIPAVPGAYKSPDLADQLRLRLQILVSGQNLVANDVRFKLQYRQATDASCTNGSWTDLDVGGTGTAAWRYGTNTVTDSTALSNSRLSPASDVKEVFSKSITGGTTPNGATTSQTIEYDWLIQNNAAAGGSEYRIRPVETNSTGTTVVLLGEYNDANPATSKCPGLVTRPQTDQLLRHGEFFQDGVDQGFIWAD